MDSSELEDDPEAEYPPRAAVEARRRLHRVLGAACGALASAIGVVVLCGWIFALPSLTSTDTGATVKANTALCLIALGLAIPFHALAPQRRRSRNAALFLASFSALGAILTIFEHVTGVNLGIDTLLFADPASALHPGRPALVTVINISFSSISLILVVLGRCRAVAQSLMLLAGAGALLALIGYAYDIRTLYALLGFSAVAAQAAGGLFLISAGLLLAGPEYGLGALLIDDALGSKTARRLLPVTVFGPLVIGTLCLHMSRFGLLDTTLAQALVTLLVAAILSVLVCVHSARMRREEIGHERIFHHLLESEVRLNVVIAASNASVWEIDVAHERVSRTHSPSGRANGAPAPQPLETWWKRVHPDDLERLQATYAALLSGELPAFQVEQRLTDDTGSFRWVLLHGVCIRDADGNPRRIVLLGLDIEERKHLEEQLLSANLEAIAVSRAFPDLQLRLGRDGEVLDRYRSPRTDRYLPAALGPAANIRNSLPFEVGERFTREIARSLASNDPTTFEYSLSQPSGAEWYEVRIVPLRRDEVFCVIRYITERKKTDIKLLLRAYQQGTVASISQKALESEALGEVSENAVHGAQHALGAEQGMVVLVSEATDDITVLASTFASDVAGELLADFVVPVNSEGREVLRSGATKLIDGRLGAARAKVFGEAAPAFEEIVLVPMLGIDRRLGLLIFHSPERRAWDREDLLFLEAVANVLGAAIERKRTSDELYHSQAHLAAVIANAPGVIFAFDERGTITLSEGSALKLVGLTPGEIVGRSAFEFGATMPNFIANLHRALTGESFISLGHFDNRVFESRYAPLRGRNGALRGSVCVAIDVTARYEAEQVRQRLSRRLMQAEETERRRIARDLHDGVNQILASALFRLRAAAAASSMTGDDTAHLEQGIEQVVEAVQDIRGLVQNLRPGALERMGLRVAVERMCNELQSGAGVEVELTNADKMENLKDDVALTLYRILQESLHNVRKHARATHVRIHFERSRGDLLVRIADDGEGLTQADNGDGGLRNIRERVAFLGGTTRVDSDHGRGVEIQLRIPLGDPELEAGYG